MNWKNIAERAVWTFFEGFVAALPITNMAGMEKAEIYALLVGAVAAGVSALKTLMLEIIAKKKNDVPVE